MLEDVCGGVGLPTTDSNLDGHVAYLLLHVGRESLHFLKRIGDSGGKFRYFLLKFRRRNTTGVGEAGVPHADIVPGAGGFRAEIGIAWEIFDVHAALDSKVRRHVRFYFNS